MLNIGNARVEGCKEAAVAEGYRGGPLGKISRKEKAFLGSCPYRSRTEQSINLNESGR